MIADASFMNVSAMNLTGCGEMNEFIANAYLTPFQSWTFLILIGYLTWRFIR